MDLNKNIFKVLMLAPDAPVGGIATWLKILLKYSDDSKIKYIIVDTTKRYQCLGSELDMYGALCGMYDAFKRFFSVMAILVKDRPNLVYFTCAPSIGLVVRDSFYMYILAMFRIKFVAHLHGGNVNGFFGGCFVRKIIVRSALKKCKRLIVITREIENSAVVLFGRDKVCYIPNMIDCDSVDNHQRNEACTNIVEYVKILHVAWLSKEKGSFDLVDSMEYIKGSVLCYLVGPAPNSTFKLLDEKAKIFNVEGKIKITGQKIGNDLLDLYKNADIFVLPTHREGPEGFPMVILEAMSHGIPIIANNVGNIAEMIGAYTDEPAGILLENVDPVSPREIATHIDYLVANPEIRKQFSINGKKRINDHYLARTVVPVLESLLIQMRQ